MFIANISTIAGFWKYNFDNVIRLTVLHSCIEFSGNRSLKLCVARVCCKSARPSNSTQTIDGCGVSQLLCFRCMQVITAHTIIAYITHDDRPNISSASSRHEAKRFVYIYLQSLWPLRKVKHVNFEKRHLHLCGLWIDPSRLENSGCPSTSKQCTLFDSWLNKPINHCRDFASRFYVLFCRDTLHRRRCVINAARESNSEATTKRCHCRLRVLRIHRVKWRRIIYGHDMIVILWV